MSSRAREAAVVAGDFLLILLAYVLAYYARFHGVIPHRNFVPLPVLAPLLALVGVLLLVTYDTHRNLHRAPADLAISLALATAVGTAVGMAFPYLLGAPAFPRSVFLIAAPFQFLLLTASRWPLIIRAREQLRRLRVLAVGADAAGARQLAARVRASFGTERVDPLEEDRLREILASEPAGRTEEASPDAIFIGAGVSPAAREAAQAWALSRGIAYYAVPSLYDVLMTRSLPTQVGDSPVVVARRPGIPTEYGWLKRLLDLAGAAVLGIVGLPFLAVAAVLVRITSPGPVLYTQTRVGLGGRPFTILKLRTMRPDAEAETGAVLASDADPRVTPVGRVLRALRLDELPQLWNVLRGEMSLVGPRPERPEFVQAFLERNPLYGLRHNVRPGLTGLAQVSAGYAAEWEEKLRHDLTYIAQASLLLDLKIVILTLRAVLAPDRTGAFHGFDRSAAADARARPW